MDCLLKKRRERKLADYYMERAHYAFLLINISTMMGGKKKNIEDLIGTLPEFMKRSMDTGSKNNEMKNKNSMETWIKNAAKRGLKTSKERT